MSNRMRVWIPTIAIILVLTVSLWGLWIWNDQRHLSDPHRVEKLLRKGYVIKSSYPNGTLILERRLSDGTIKRRTIMPTASTIIPSSSGAASGHQHSTSTTTKIVHPQQVSSHREKKITVTPHAHSHAHGTCHTTHRQSRYHHVKPRKSRVRKFFHDVKKVLSGGTGHKHDTVVGTTMVGNKKITCKVNCESRIVKKPVVHKSTHTACNSCCNPCCNGQPPCQYHPRPAAAHHAPAHANANPCHPHQQQQQKKPVQKPISASHPSDCHSHHHTKPHPKAHTPPSCHSNTQAHPRVAHPVVKVRVYHQDGLKVRVYKHKFHDLHGHEHTVHAHTIKHNHPTHVQHQISLHKHQVTPNTSYNPIIPASSSHASHHLYVPPHVSQHNEYYFKGTKGVKHLGHRKRNGIEYDCWGNVPQTVAFSPQYYGHHKNILIEVPKDKKGHKLPITPKTTVTFCVRVTK